jgi:hypothetical protein
LVQDLTLTFIREVSNSNLGQAPIILTEGLPGFRQSLKVTAVLIQLGYGTFLLHSFQSLPKAITSFYQTQSVLQLEFLNKLQTQNFSATKPEIKILEKLEFKICYQC